MSGDILARLQAAQSEAEREWAVLEFSLDGLAPALREAVWAAAVPHWFDAAMLAALLDKPLEETEALVAELARLSFVEPFPGRGYNIHERTRTLLLERLWREAPDRYQELSRNAAEYSSRQDQNETAWRVETIYHLVVADPKRGVSQLQNTGWEWHNNFTYDKVDAMARAAREHADGGRLHKGGVGWTLFWEALLDVDYSRPRDAKEKFQRIETAVEDDPYLTADTLFRLGDVHVSLAEYPAARQRYEQALPIYREIGARLGEANCISSLGDVHVSLDEYPAARQRYEQALPIYREIGARLGEANCIRSLGDVHVRLDEYPAARQRYEQALPIYREIGARLGEANCISALGDVHVSLAEYPAARQRYEQALPIYREIGARLGEANCIRSLGDVHVRLAEYPAARQRYEQALPIYREIGARLGEANCISSLGDVHVRLAEYPAARQRYEQALPIYREIGARLGEANCIRSLGDVHVRLDEYPAARQRYEQALPIYREIGARLGEANCIRSLGDVALAINDTGEALACYQAALEQYRALELPNDMAGAATRIADLYERGKEYAQSEAHYTQAIDLAPENPMWRRNRAILYTKLGDAARAAADLAGAARLQPDHPFLHLRYGDLALLQARYADAGAHYRSFIAVLPNANSGHFGLALALAGLGDREGSLAALEQALALTYERQDVIDASEDVERMAQRDAQLGAGELLLPRLRAWLEAHPLEALPPK